MFDELNKQNCTVASNQVPSAYFVEARMILKQNFNFCHKTKWNGNICTKFDVLCTMEYIVLNLTKITWTVITVQECDKDYMTICCMYSVYMLDTA